MKRISIYTVIKRLPNSIDYEYNTNRRKWQKKMEPYRRRRKYTKENIKNQKLSVNCYIHDKKIIICCPICHHDINQNVIGHIRYIRCNNCSCLCDIESKIALKFYRKHWLSKYQEIYNRRLKNRNDRHRLETIHRKEQEERYLKRLYPLITVWINEDGMEEIVTLITKEIRESDNLTSDVKDALIRLQIPVERYKLLKILGIDFCHPDISESGNSILNMCNNIEEGFCEK